MALREFKLPDPGEGLTEAEIVTWHVKPGDTVKVNDVVVEIETAKSLVELPVPFAGTCRRAARRRGRHRRGRHADHHRRRRQGGRARCGSGRAGASGAHRGDGGAGGRRRRRPRGPGRGGQAEGAMAGRTAVLVGYGVKQTEADPAPPQGSAGGHVDEVSAASGPAVVTIDECASSVRAEGGHESSNVSAPYAGEKVRALAKPPVRKLAKDLGVDLGSVTPTGDGGIVTRADVEAAASGATAASPPPPPARAHPRGRRRDPGPRQGRPQDDGAGHGRLARSPLRTSPSGSRSTSRRRWSSSSGSSRTGSSATSRSPRSSSSPRRCASPSAATPRSTRAGTRRRRRSSSSTTSTSASLPRPPAASSCPNVKDADAMTMRELADAIATLTATAREGRTPPADMAGGTITITNVGVFGVDAGTPILNPGRPRSSPSARSPGARGSSAPAPTSGSSRAGSRRSRCPSTTASSTASSAPATSRTSPSILSDPSRGLVWG